MTKAELSARQATASPRIKTKIRDCISLLRIYLAPIYIALLWTNWAVESGTLFSSSSSMQTGWDLTQGSMLGALGFIVTVAILQYLIRIPSPRMLIGRVSLQLGAALVTFIHFVAAALFLFSTLDPGKTLIGLRLFSDLGEYQPGYYVAMSLAWFYLLAAMFEAIVFVVGSSKKPSTRSPFADPSVELDHELAALSDETDEVVLLIHGTGSASTDVKGERWWQIGSTAWRALNDRLPAGARCHRQGVVFQWSGHNSERARREAGKNLHGFLNRLEERKTRYHVIAHSHGGSVLWHALQRAVGREKHLSHLQSWTTLGTPFLRYQPYRNAWALALPLAAALLLVFANTAWLRAATSVWGLLINGGYYPTILLLIAIAAATSLLVAYNTYRVIKVTCALVGCHRQTRLDGRVFNLYGATWLPLWSRSDEAIAGLQGTIHVVRGATSQTPRVTMNPFTRLARIVNLPSRLGYERIVRPIVDEFVWERLMRKIQGNDLGDHRLKLIAASPIADVTHPPLGDDIEHELVESANSNCEKSGGLLRASLGLAASSEYRLAQVGEHLGSLLNGKELVHWSYYQVHSVLDRIADHVRSHMGDEGSVVELAEGGVVFNEGSEEAAFASHPHSAPHDRSGMRALVIAQLALLGCIALVGQMLHRYVLDQFTPERQIKEVIWRLPEGRIEDTDALVRWSREYVRAGLADADTAVDEKYRRTFRLDSHVQFALVWALADQQKIDAAVKLTNQIGDPFCRTSAAILLCSVDPAALIPLRLRNGNSDLSSNYGEDPEQVRRVSQSMSSAGTREAFARSTLELNYVRTQVNGLVALARFMGGRRNYGKELSEAALMHARAWTADDEAMQALVKARAEQVGPIMTDSSFLEFLITLHPFEDWSDRSDTIARKLLELGSDAEVEAATDIYVRYGGWHAILALATAEDLAIDETRQEQITITLFEALRRHDILRSKANAVADLLPEAKTRFEEYQIASRRIRSAVDHAMTFKNIPMAIEVSREKSDEKSHDISWLDDDVMRIRLTEALIERGQLELAREIATDMMFRTVGPNYDEWTPTWQACKVGRLLAKTGQFFYARKMYPHMSAQSHRVEVDAAILANYTRQLAESDNTPETTYVALYHEKDHELGLNRSSSIATRAW